MGDAGLTEVNSTEAAEEIVIEGVAETFWFGFKDDVVVRIANGEIDIRSVSRVGVSDLGANSTRIATLRAAIEARVAE